MRFNVISLAFALAAPAMGAAVGFQRGGNGVVQEVETTPAAATPTPLVPVVGNSGLVVAPSQAQSATTKANTVPTPTPVAGGQKTATTPSAGGQKTVTTPSAAGKVTPTPTPAPAPTSAASPSSAGSTGGNTGGSTGGNVPEGTNGNQLLIIENKYGAALNIASDKSGGGNPSNVKSQMANGETQTITIPSGWSGRFAANPSGVPAASQEGTKIEGSNTGPGFWDISLVDGYTVPITCTCGAETKPFIGCNIDLMKQGAKCPKPSGSSGLCLNPTLRLDHTLDSGPADPWFAACQNAAYTFPKNDIATQPCAKTLTCCIGTSCAAPASQKGKRELSPVAKRWAFKRDDIIEAN